MHILAVYTDLKVGGVQHMTTKLANAWVANGHAVTLAIGFREPELEPYPLDPRVELIDFATLRGREYIQKLAALLRSRPEFDICYTGTTVPNISAVLARMLARTRVRLVLSERDNPEHGFAALSNRKDRMIWRMKPWAYKRADAVVCVSTPLADALSRFARIPRAALTVIHNPAEPEDRGFLNAPPPHPWLAQRQPPVVVAAGRMHPQKDFPMLVRAFATLRARRPVRLALLGDGSERGAVETLVDELGVREDVLLPGMQKDILPWLVHGDVFAMSSTFEGFGNVLVQALAAGSPIVSTDCPDGPAEILDHGRFGTLTPVGDAGAMAAAIDRTLDAPRDRDRQRTRAAEFSVATIAGRYERLFEGML